MLYSSMFCFARVEQGFSLEDFDPWHLCLVFLYDFGPFRLALAWFGYISLNYIIWMQFVSYVHK